MLSRQANFFLTLSFLFISTISFAQRGGDEEGGGTPPSNPPNPTASTNTCGNKTLTRSGTPPLGVSWYWQTSSVGKSYGNSNSSYTATTTKTYYIRAFDHGTFLWSTGTGSKYVTVSQNPSTPIAPVVTNYCGSTRLTRGSHPSGQTLYWQSSSSGTSTSNSASYVTRTSGTVYYLRARSSAGCWSTARTISYSINYNPGTPASPTITQYCGSTRLTRGSHPSGQTLYWQSSSSGTSTSNSGSYVTMI